jgi:hypothetical protein
MRRIGLTRLRITTTRLRPSLKRLLKSMSGHLKKSFRTGTNSTTNCLDISILFKTLKKAEFSSASILLRSYSNS